MPRTVTVMAAHLVYRVPMRLPDRRVLLADRRVSVAAVAAAIVLIGGLLTWAWWPAPVLEPEPPRAREYRDYTVCLLTDEQGIAGPDAAPVWAGIQDAALPALVRSQHLPVVGEQTPDNAATFVATLTQTGCNVIIAAGPVPASGVNASAPRFSAARFYVVGGPSAAANVTAIPTATPAELRESIRALVAATLPPAR